MEDNSADKLSAVTKVKTTRKSGAQNLAGFWNFFKWILVGVALAAGFALGNTLVRFIVACLLFVWVLAGPFLLSWCLIDLSSRAFSAGSYNLSEAVARLALSLDELVKPLVNLIGLSTSPFNLFNNLNLANALMVNGDFAQAEEILTTALSQTEKMPDFAVSLTPLIASHMATVILYRGDFDRAENMLERSLNIKLNRLQLATLAEDERLALELGVAADLYTTGGLLEKRTMLEEAEVCYADAISRVEKFADTLDNDGELKSNFLNGMGDLYLKLGRVDEAGRMIKEGFALRDRKFSADHPIMSSSYENLGRFGTVSGDFQSAEKYLEKARKIRHKYGRKNPADLGDTMRSIGLMQLAQDKLALAEESLKQSLTMKEKVFGRDFPDVAETLEVLARVYERSERLEEASAASAEAARIRAKFRKKEY